MNFSTTLPVEKSAESTHRLLHDVYFVVAKWQEELVENSKRTFYTFNPPRYQLRKEIFLSWLQLRQPM